MIAFKDVLTQQLGLCIKDVHKQQQVWYEQSKDENGWDYTVN